MATLRHKLANVISGSHSMLRLSIMKIFYPKNIFFSGIQRFSPNVVIDTDRKSKIQFGHRVSIHSGGRFTSNSGGELRIGNSTSFNAGCIITCKDRITIGKNNAFGPRVMIYDHDHVFNSVNGVKNSDFALDCIEIGDNCWIGAGTIILRGTHIGSNCIIAAGSVVKGTVPDNTILIQKRTNTYKGVEQCNEFAENINHYSGI